MEYRVGANPLTRNQRPPYHRFMHSWRTGLLLVAFLSLAGTGCEDAARKPVQARVPALQPANPQSLQASAPRQSASAPLVPLPLWSRGKAPVSLLPQMADGKALLIAKVQAKFASGEQ